jgi:hypothetical protein
MNPILKSIISFLLKLPLYSVLAFGVVLLTQSAAWWCVLICGFILLSYDAGEMLRRGDWK